MHQSSCMTIWEVNNDPFHSCKFISYSSQSFWRSNLMGMWKCIPPSWWFSWEQTHWPTLASVLSNWLTNHLQLFPVSRFLLPESMEQGKRFEYFVHFVYCLRFLQFVMFELYMKKENTITTFYLFSLAMYWCLGKNIF